MSCGSTATRSSKVKPNVVIYILVFIFVFIILASSIFIVDQKEQGVVIRFGRFNRLTEPGLHMKLPFGIERKYKVPTQMVLKDEFGFRTEKAGVTTVYSELDFPDESIMLTGDLNIVDVEWIIQYRIVDPVNWLLRWKTSARPSGIYRSQ